VLLTHDLSPSADAATRPAGLDYAAGEDAPLRAALAALEAGRRCALVTIVGVEGASPRPIGAQMAVEEDGSWTGYISGGCLESAVALEAQAALARGEARVERYGRGSKYIDIVLPCGSGIDLFIDPAPDVAALSRVADALDARREASLTLRLPDGAPVERRYTPTLKIIAAGRGPAVPALLDMAAAMGLKTAALSPDAPIAALARGRWESARLLAGPNDQVDIEGDAYSALVLLFHDHYWETELLASAVRTECFYIGAMGSRATHAQRVVRLADRGLDDSQIGRVRGPIGLFPHAKRPGDLALSVLAEIVGEFRARYGA
jgi:xanthine dehydrogenase accessory factor